MKDQKREAHHRALETQTKVTEKDESRELSVSW
jgi:hypothetical protein